jgi:hypothetical protein
MLRAAAHKETVSINFSKKAPMEPQCPSDISGLGAREVGLWARTLIPAKGAAAGWVQADRGARPSQTPFLSGEQNEAYRAGEPADDASQRIALIAFCEPCHKLGYVEGAALRRCDAGSLAWA